MLANRLSAKSANQVLLCEAGQDTPHGKVPEAILDSYPGVAAIDKQFLWADLKVSTEIEEVFEMLGYKDYFDFEDTGEE